MDKAERILLVFCRLLKHEWLNKTNLALEFNTTERTIERDMQSSAPSFPKPAARSYFSGTGRRGPIS